MEKRHSVKYRKAFMIRTWISNIPGEMAWTGGLAVCK